MISYVFVTHKFPVPKLIFCVGETQTHNKVVTQFLVVGEGGWLTSHQLTKNQAMLPSLSAHLLGARWQCGGGGGGRCRRRQAAAVRRRDGNEDTGGDSDGGGTDNNQQSTKIGGSNGNGNGNDDSDDNT